MAARVNPEGRPDSESTPEESPLANVAPAVPAPLQAAAAWSWRILLVVGFFALVWYLFNLLAEVMVPLLVALLLCAALIPLRRALEHAGWPGWLASLVPMIVLVLVVAGLLTLVGTQIAAQWALLTSQTVKGVTDLLGWLAQGPLHISEAQINAWLEQIRQQTTSSQTAIARYLAQFGTSIGRFVAGVLMAIFATFFFLKDGQRIGGGLKRLIPADARPTLGPGLDNGWRSLVNYVRAAVAVAAADGLGAGVGALILGSNLWLAITALTFVCAFIPLLGAFVAGTVAVVVTLVTLGWLKALIMLAVFVGVMSLESHLLQPLLLGRASSLHPLVVLTGIAVGIILGGIAGGVLAIPILAFLAGVWRGTLPDNGPAAVPEG